MAAVLSENRYFKEYIKETEKLIRSSEVLTLRLKADKYYNHLIERNADANDSAKKINEGYLFATLAWYRSLKETFPDEAMGIIERGAETVAREDGEKMVKFSKIPGMKSLFMSNIGRETKKLYGPDAGFKTKFISDNGSYVQFDVSDCRIKNFCEEYGLPELTHVFCMIEAVSYGNAKGIEFTRKHSVNDGDDLCDFRFEHISGPGF